MTEKLENELYELRKSLYLNNEEMEEIERQYAAYGYYENDIDWRYLDDTRRDLELAIAAVHRELAAKKELDSEA